MKEEIEEVIGNEFEEISRHLSVGRKSKIRDNLNTMQDCQPLDRYFRYLLFEIITIYIEVILFQKGSIYRDIIL